MTALTRPPGSFREIARLSRVVAALATGLGVVFFLIGRLLGLSFWENFIFAIGIIVALVGVMTVAIGQRWPRLGGRYEGRRNPSGASPWDAMDAGQDPTAGHDDG